MITNKSGVWGEIYAARYLRDRGYKIVCSNYICRFGEIDIIASSDDILAFVEVKTRSNNAFMNAADAVDEGKRKRLEMTAKAFIKQTETEGKFRFDVCEVYLDTNNIPQRINYIEAAF